ncbi:hypothetical protein INT48_001684 [Thamnidium elegans]|uniref:C2H2-type domain-containing protein n=1 Tax=Thamnidium elegans TaxID=101142 RepID=A0A8H7SRI7_9FUNG|nr:hypothetical protein INT48_001684 [Thamnidium elegans]
MKSETINTVEKYLTVPRTKSRVERNAINTYERLMNRPRTRSAVKIEMLDIKQEPSNHIGIPDIQPEHTNQTPRIIQEVNQPENRVQDAINRPRTRNRVKQEQDETFFCGICGEKFKSVKMRSDHELEVHDHKVKITIDLLNNYCDLCNRKYGNVAQYRKHMKTVHEIDVSPESRRPKRDMTKIPDIKDPHNHCICCKHTYSSVKDFRSHLKRIHNIIPGIQIKNLTVEPPVHSPDNRCTTCERKFSNKVTYRHHLRRFHKMNLPELNSDPNNFDRERLLCKVCGTKFKNYNNFRAHIRVTHRAPHITLIQHPDLKPDINDPNLFCAMCDKTYKRKDTYICHLAEHHTDILPELYIGKRGVKVSKTNKAHGQYCSQCRSVFLSKPLYRMHLKKIHGRNLIDTKPDPDDPNSHCASCNKTYSDKNIYRKHLMDLHSMDLKPLTVGLKVMDKIPIVDTVNHYCNVCDKSYTPYFYSTHLLKAHGLDVPPTRLGRNVVNRFQTPIIDRESLYCSACNKVYKNKGAHRNHLNRVHGITLPRLGSKHINPNHDIIPDINDVKNYCASCDRTYTNPGSYRLHLTRIHKMKIKRVKQECSDELVNVLVDDASL